MKERKLMIKNTSGTIGAIVFYSPTGPGIIISKVNDFKV